MLHIYLKQIRVLVVIGTLFFFVDCAGRVKSWKFYDSQSLEVRVLNTRDWLDSVKEVKKDLDIIMSKEIRYYLDRDMRIYDRIEPNYEAMEVSINTIDSVLLRITSVHNLMKNTPGDSLKSVPKDSSLSYSAMIKSSSKDIALAIKAYNKGLKKLKRGFRKDRKKLVFIKDEYQQFKNTLYEIKYKRDLLQSDLSDFYKKLNEALFKNNGTIYSKRVIKTSKQLERLKSRLDSFEQFLVDINKVAKEEVGALVILKSAADKRPFKFVTRFEKGLRQYQDSLEEMRNILENI